MSSGDKPINSVQMRGDGFANYSDGMTYREWLIGQALCGLMAYPEEAINPNQFAEVCVKHVDAIIAYLDKEIK